VCILSIRALSFISPVDNKPSPDSPLQSVSLEIHLYAEREVVNKREQAFGVLPISEVLPWF